MLIPKENLGVVVAWGPYQDAAMCVDRDLLSSGEDVEIPLKLNVKDNEGFVLSWEDFDVELLEIDDRLFLGYQIYYKEVEDGETPDMFKDRDACRDRYHRSLPSPHSTHMSLFSFQLAYDIRGQGEGSPDQPAQTEHILRFLCQDYNCPS